MCNSVFKKFRSLIQVLDSINLLQPFNFVPPFLNDWNGSFEGVHFSIYLVLVQFYIQIHQVLLWKGIRSSGNKSEVLLVLILSVSGRSFEFPVCIYSFVPLQCLSCFSFVSSNQFTFSTHNYHHFISSCASILPLFLSFFISCSLLPHTLPLFIPNLPIAPHHSPPYPISLPLSSLTTFPYPIFTSSLLLSSLSFPFPPILSPFLPPYSYH